MKILRVFTLMLMLLMSVNFIACGGSKSQTDVKTSTTTLGQELQDLKTAYDKGIITEKEYEKAKKKLIYVWVIGFYKMALDS